ncbi:MAG: 23S rRNA (guanosine(2251)-2'-O)-methyltransferase RlmB [Erysipelotrichaceae bacterium]|nr:23S rRNA (guanosine(2251)-2'-O)-methyltransferase RlmB [Erysipelotrichaceae bacterium]
MAQYVYGKNVVFNLLKNHRDIKTLYVQDTHSNDEAVQQARKQGITVRNATRQQLDSLVKGNHQGYVAEVMEYPTYSIEDITAGIPEGKLPLLVALDELKDPHNLGAILRTVACVGGDGVIIEKNRSVSLNGTVAKVSVGALDTVKVAQVTNLVQTLRQLKKQGYWIIGTDVHEASDYRQLDYNMPVVLVIGSEASGMRRLVSEECDFRIRIPMEGSFESLNASVACGVILYQIYSQRFPLK